MVSLRFPFSFFQLPKISRSSFTPTAVRCGVATAAVAFGASATVAATVKKSEHNELVQGAFNFIFGFLNPHGSPSPFWASLSLSDSSGSPSYVTDSKTGASFPSMINDSQSLLGVGVRKKCILGLKNIDVYAFGVYANEGDVRKAIEEKYGKLSASELKSLESLRDDLMENDVSLTVRLQIVYGKLSIKSVRSAFEDSVGSRLRKFGGSDDKDLLQRFTSQFKDDYKIPRGSVIELSRKPGHVLCTTIDGNEVGSIQSKLLCRSVFDLYIGDDSFDHKAKEEVVSHLATVLENK